ncbi:hypothetical protein SAMN02745945_00925 [Peptoclostridium litorale DSM 5388]|uniref:Uncharacterized protein n=1 Tax=Peptoclostridium litorale DSM 5388 TaxID=1121324 RepID=A0A069RB07_PEPLI|nr:hypothetical protein CLIT_23c05120 [Peptoclostridium litorale DSM 5388]SIN82785.1 hypothetical protein SAMN02745945_00925 [Peptoclostridium litorale DSM 5388]
MSKIKKKQMEKRRNIIVSIAFLFFRKSPFENYRFQPKTMRKLSRFYSTILFTIRLADLFSVSETSKYPVDASFRLTGLLLIINRLSRHKCHIRLFFFTHST